MNYISEHIVDDSDADDSNDETNENCEDDLDLGYLDKIIEIHKEMVEYCYDNGYFILDLNRNESLSDFIDLCIENTKDVDIIH